LKPLKFPLRNTHNSNYPLENGTKRKIVKSLIVAACLKSIKVNFTNFYTNLIQLVDNVYVHKVTYKYM
jgi:hypothetical protein